MDASSLGMLVASLAVTWSLLGVHATPSPVLRCVLLAIAASGLAGRLVHSKRINGVHRFADVVADVLACLGFAFVAGPVKGVTLALLAMLGCTAINLAGDDRVRRSGVRGRSIIFIVACLGGSVVAATGRWLHVWMQGALLIVCITCVVALLRSLSLGKG